MADDKKIVVDDRGRPLDGWHCTQCEAKIEASIMDGYPATLSPILKQAMCHRCKKMKVIKFWKQS